MKITATLQNLTDNFYAELASMAPREIYDYLRKLKNDLPHCIKIKIGNGQFRDAVDLNSMMRTPCTYTYKLEPRRGYKLATFEVSKGRSMMPNITLSTGRVIVHAPYLNGATMATPSTGPQEMTDAEYAEYLQLRNIKGTT